MNNIYANIFLDFFSLVATLAFYVRQFKTEMCLLLADGHHFERLKTVTIIIAEREVNEIKVD